MKRSRIHKYLLIVLVGGVLAGCTASPVEDIVPAEAQPVTLSFGKPDLGMPEVMTRAGDGTSTNANPTWLPAGSTVRIGAYYLGNVGITTQPASFATTAPSFEATYVVGQNGSLSPCLVNDAGEVTSLDAEELVVRGGVYDFYAVSPARKLAQGADGNYMITGIPHKEDVMTSFVRGVTITPSSREVQLATFRRKCALVVFNVAPDDGGVAFKKLFGKRLVVSEISISGASLIAGDNQTVISATGGSTSSDATVTFESSEFKQVDVDPQNLGLNKTKGILLPKNNTPFNIEIVVQRDEEEATLKATIDKKITFDEGKRYVFTLKVTNDACALEMTAHPWTTISFKDDNVGGTPGGFYLDPDINIGKEVPIVVAEWKGISWTGNGDVGGKTN